MTDNSDKEISLELTKLSRQSIAKRKDIEWKVGFGFWTGIGLFTWFAVEHLGYVHFGYRLLMLIPAYAIVLYVWGRCWQLPVHRAFFLDKTWCHYYGDCAEGKEVRLDPRGSEARKDRWWPPYWPPGQGKVRDGALAKGGYEWFWGQVLMTGIFLVISACVICLPQQPDSPLPKNDVLTVTGENVRFVLEKLAP